MGKFLDAYVSAIPGGQRQAILKLLEMDKTAGNIASKEEFDIAFEKLAKSLVTGRDFKVDLGLKHPSLTEAKPISSEMLNDNFRSILAHLHGLFLQATRADNTVTRHRAVRDADHARISAAVNKLLEDVSIFKFLRHNTDEWSELKYSNFWNRRNADNTIQAAEIDERTRNLRLRTGRARRLHQQTGTSGVKVSVTSLAPQEASGASKDYQVSNAVDTDPRSFWAHLTLSDGPLRADVDGTGYDGALLWVELEFPVVEEMATLELLPFGTHPVEVLDIQYHTGSNWAQVSGWTALAASLDWQAYSFQLVQTNRIRVLLRQLNYNKNTYLVPRRMFTRNFFWELVTNEELLSGVEEEELTAEQSIAVEANPKFRALYSALARYETRLEESGLDLDTEVGNQLMQVTDAMTHVMTGMREGDAEVILRAINAETGAAELTPDDMVEITKVEYLLGLYHIAVESRDYYPVGNYASPRYDNQGVVYEVGLDVSEQHVQKTVDGYTIPLTSVEYDVEISPTRSAPLLPEGTTRVSQEFMLVDPNTYKAKLRFTPAALPSIVLWKNGRKMGAGYSQSGRIITITTDYKKSDIYTIDYDVAANQDTFDLDATFDSVALVKPERFNQTDDNGMIKLSYYPYIAWEVVNNDEDWFRPALDHAKWMYRLEAGDVTIDGITYGPSGLREYEPLRVLVDGVLARNITDYRNREHPAFADAREDSLVYQYINVGRKLYLNRPITGSTIEVSYRWMSQYVKLNATLRGHQQVVNPYTPELQDFRMKMKTSRL
jgi:hypothetical protein